MSQPQAIIFDLDGVLTDTSEYHYQAWKHLADDEGITLTHEENDEHLRGVGRRESLMYIIRGHQYSENQIQEMMERKNRYYHALIERMTPKEVVPGGVALLEEIKSAGIKVAIASASKNCRLVLDRLQLTSYFDGIADGNCVVNGKPAPDIFVYAAGLVNVFTPNCIGVEDADAGIQAIKAAGMKAVAIGPASRFHGPDKVLPNMENKHLKDLLVE
ncbi:beta-phosphoglucomutase [Ktedonobacter sp. SOSP1-52]|uniref:beta-phosphoglucomutase n=1 Tax=Ktedonobacter sp. SOSP1-52 TaxID=2778366 RepID=UPI0019164705|nr:beta-phosphoglucomutase [Ktedonobacter sp. SOSP1-52]GHO67526.1 beta-phosphoglucomutase [Ktedonobacter sp. SOSP1-52]